MKHIYFIRHAETQGNKKQILMGGRIDSPLSVVGLEQANALAHKLQELPIKRAFVSNNTRAQDTAKILFAKGDVLVTYHDQLKEQDFGDMTGVLLADMPETVNKQFSADPYHFCHQGGESLSDVQNRVMRFLQEFVETDNAQHIAIVTHENVIKAAVGYMKGLSREITVMKFNNCSVTHYIFNDFDYEAISINTLYQ